MVTKTNSIVKTVWPANSALLIYVSTHCVDRIKSEVTHPTGVREVPSSIPFSGKYSYV